MEKYLEELREKKGLSGKYQTSSKLFQNCSELFKAQVMFGRGGREIEKNEKCNTCIFGDIYFLLPSSIFWQK